MSWYSLDDDEHFTVCLAENDPPFTISRLLRHGMKTLRDTVGDKPVFIDEFFLDHSEEADGEPPSITCGYWKIEPEQVRLRNRNVEWRKEHMVARPTKEILYLPSLDKEAELRMLEYRLPQNENQWNGILLIESLADYLEQQKISDVLDLILQNPSDKDAIDHPYVRVYYENK